jgi:hypothetical protein
LNHSEIFLSLDAGDSGQQECAIGSLRCLLNGLHEFSRTMDELAYQVKKLETFIHYQQIILSIKL